MERVVRIDTGMGGCGSRRVGATLRLTVAVTMCPPKPPLLVRASS